MKVTKWSHVLDYELPAGLSFQGWEEVVNHWSRYLTESTLIRMSKKEDSTPEIITKDLSRGYWRSQILRRHREISIPEVINIDPTDIKCGE